MCREAGHGHLHICAPGTKHRLGQQLPRSSGELLSWNWSDLQGGPLLQCCGWIHSLGDSSQWPQEAPLPTKGGLAMNILSFSFSPTGYPLLQAL